MLPIGEEFDSWNHQTTSQTSTFFKTQTSTGAFINLSYQSINGP